MLFFEEWLGPIVAMGRWKSREWQQASLIPALRDSSSLVLVVVLVVVVAFLLSCLAREVGGTLGASRPRPWQFMPHRTLLVWSKEIEDDDDEDDDDSDRESALPNIGGHARSRPRGVSGHEEAPGRRAGGFAGWSGSGGAPASPHERQGAKAQKSQRGRLGHGPQQVEGAIEGVVDAGGVVELDGGAAAAFPVTEGQVKATTPKASSMVRRKPSSLLTPKVHKPPLPGSTMIVAVALTA